MSTLKIPDGSGGWVTVPQGITGETGSLGPQGVQGIQGIPGVHVGPNPPVDGETPWVDTDAEDLLPIPPGGTSGQVLAKINGDDFNTQWVDAAAPVPESILWTSRVHLESYLAGPNAVSFETTTHNPYGSFDDFGAWMGAVAYNVDWAGYEDYYVARPWDPSKTAVIGDGITMGPDTWFRDQLTWPTASRAAQINRPGIVVVKSTLVASAMEWGVYSGNFASGDWMYQLARLYTLDGVTAQNMSYVKTFDSPETLAYSAVTVEASAVATEPKLLDLWFNFPALASRSAKLYVSIVTDIDLFETP